MLICVCWKLVANMLASSTTRWSEDEMIFFNTETLTAQSTSANQQPVSSWAVRLKYGDELVEPETTNKFRWIRMSSAVTHRETDADYRRRKQAGLEVFKALVVFFQKKTAAENSEYPTETETTSSDSFQQAWTWAESCRQTLMLEQS